MNNLFEEYPDVMTVEQVAKALQVSKSHVYSMVTNEGLPNLKLGKAIRISKKQLIAYILEEDNEE